MSMRSDFKIAPLRCPECGAELPVRGHFITFQCPSCMQHWLLRGGNLTPLVILRVVDDKGPSTDTIYIPFWIFPVNARKLAQDIINGAETNEKIAISNAKAEILKRESGSTPFIGKRELEYFLDRYLNRQTINIFVPAFLSRNPYAYIKVGRLMTSHQIKFKATSSRGISQVLCALSEEMAEKLLDFIFISTLPENIKLAGHFLENLHLEPEGRASLVEFPFIPRGNYLISVLGGFSVSRKLIMLPSDMALIG